MLLKRNNKVSDSDVWQYPISKHRAICFFIESDRSIDMIGLIDWRKASEMALFDIKSLCYMENITIDDGELLNVDALMALARREDNA